MNLSDIQVQEQDVQTKQGRVFVRSFTDKNANPNLAPIIMLHDSLGCVDLWRSFPASLAHKTKRVIYAYDRLGFGRSEVRTDIIPLDFIRQEAEEQLPQLIDALGLNDFILLGHSVGGGMSVNGADILSAHCKGLITIAAQTFAEDLTLSSIRDAQHMFDDPTQLGRLEKYHGERARWVVDAWVNSWLAPGFADWTLKDVLPNVTCPTLVIHGQQDEYGTKVHPEMIANLSSGPSELDLMADTHHVPHREKEDIVVNRISRFIKEHISS